jgi:hypothetical protein
MTVLLKDALSPNLVQTLEGTPAFIHGGPFANIAHGCNSVLATTTALKLADYVVTEAGFGADLGGEKFIDIKCRKTGPQARRGRAGRHHPRAQDAWRREEGRPQDREPEGARGRHVQPAAPCRERAQVRLEPVISINRFSADTDAEIALVKSACAKLGVEAVMADHWAEGGKGAADVARAVVKVIESGKSNMKLLYPDDMPLFDKIRTIASEIYRARDISAPKPVRDQLASFEAMGYGKVPVCIAKTQYSFSTNPDHQRRARLASNRGTCAEVPSRGGRSSCGNLRRHQDHARASRRCRRPKKNFFDRPPRRRARSSDGGCRAPSRTTDHLSLEDHRECDASSRRWERGGGEHRACCHPSRRGPAGPLRR